MPVIAAIHGAIKHPLKLPHPVGAVRDGDLTDLLRAAFAHGMMIVQPTV